MKKSVTTQYLAQGLAKSYVLRILENITVNILMYERREVRFPAVEGEGYPKLYWELATESN